MSDSGFCTLCSHRIKSFEKLTKCPNCGTTGVPCDDANTLDNLTINTHELRLLCIWAENYAHSITGKEGINDRDKEVSKTAPDVVYAIARRLKANNPRLASEVLTMADEFRAIKQAGYHFTTRVL
jgi:hypothetical protein